MADQLSFASLDFAAKKKRTKRDLFLGEMSAVVPWGMLETLIEPHYPVAGRGRRPYPLESMLRVHLMQNWFALSDPAMEEALYEIASLRAFAHLSLGEAIPDETTILNFRHLLEANDLAEDILADRAKFFAGFFKDFYGIGLMSQPVSDEVVEWSRAVSMQAGLRGVLECAKSFSSTDFRPDLKAFTVPTLILHGTDDATVPIAPSARAAARGIAGSILHEIDGGPHGLLASHKQQISGELIAFLRGV